MDARQALTTTQIATITGWRHRAEPFGIATARHEAGRLAKRIIELEAELADNRVHITEPVTAKAPEMLKLRRAGGTAPGSVETRSFEAIRVAGRARPVTSWPR